MKTPKPSASCICTIISTVIGACVLSFSAIYMSDFEPAFTNGLLKYFKRYEWLIAATSLGIIAGAVQVIEGLYFIHCMFTGKEAAGGSHGLLGSTGFFFLLTIIAFSIGIHYEAHKYSSDGELFVAFCGVDWIFCVVAGVVLHMMQK